MRRSFLHIAMISLLILAFPETILLGQYHENTNAADSPLTIVYDIVINTKSKKAGIEETYNGGIKTIMKDGNQCRIRMVSLMRIQNIYIFNPGGSNQEVIISKESGTNKYQYPLNAAQWKNMNSKYQLAACSFENETRKIAGYTCKKALIRLNNGQTITAFYSTALPALHKEIEPAFEKIPGLVLQYEITTAKGTIRYAASKVNTSGIDESIFNKPTFGAKRNR